MSPRSVICARPVIRGTERFSVLAHTFFEETFCPCVCLVSVWPSSTFRVFCILDPNSRGIGFEVLGLGFRV